MTLGGNTCLRTKLFVAQAACCHQPLCARSGPETGSNQCSTHANNECVTQAGVAETRSRYLVDRRAACCVFRDGRLEDLCW